MTIFKISFSDGVAIIILVRFDYNVTSLQFSSDFRSLALKSRQEILSMQKGEFKTALKTAQYYNIKTL